MGAMRASFTDGTKMRCSRKTVVQQGDLSLIPSHSSSLEKMAQALENDSSCENCANFEEKKVSPDQIPASSPAYSAINVHWP